MRRLLVLLNLLAVASLLTLGAGATSAGAAPMGCHEMASVHAMPGPADRQTPDHPRPAKAAMVMACCVACVTPTPTPPPASVIAHRPVTTTPAPVDLPAGLAPSPEHGPPRRLA